MSLLKESSTGGEATWAELRPFDDSERLEFDKKESDRRIRQRSLEIAIDQNRGSAALTADQTLEVAVKYSNFILGK